MTAPAGPCEWCGGPQNWTFIQGEMFVRCKRGCQPLPLDGMVPAPPPEDVDRVTIIRFEHQLRQLEGTIEGRGVVPREGWEANGSEDELPWDEVE